MKTLTFVLLVFALASCCKSKQKDIIRLSQSDLSVNLYTGNEILEFIDDSSQIITYNSGVRSSTMEELGECYGGCCDYYLVETSNNTHFESEYLQSNLEITITNQFYRYTGKQFVPILSFTWAYKEVYENTTYSNYAILPVDSIEVVATNQEIFKDSLIIRNTMYYQVFTLPGICSGEDRLFADTLFYTKTDGIIGLKFTDGNLWSLIN